MKTCLLHRISLLGLLFAAGVHAEPVPFAPEEALANVPGVSLARVVDLDADGDEDILVARSHEIGWLRNDRNGFAPFEVLHTLDDDPPSARGAKGGSLDITAMTLVDLDVDHQLDLVVGTGNRRQFWLRRNGFTPDGRPDFSERGQFGLNLGRVTGIVAGRFNPDQHPDLVVASDADPQLVLFINNGTRPIEFQPAQTLPLGNTVEVPEGLAVADLDDDGRLDVVYAGPSRGDIGDGLSVASVFRLMGTTSGAFEGPIAVFEQNFGADLRPHFSLLATAALDAIGPSLVFAIQLQDAAGDLLSSELRMQRPAGDGSFGLATFLHSTSDASHLAVAFEDLDRNGDADMLVARTDALVRVEGPGLAVPGPGAGLPTSGNATAMLLAFDVDLDGDPDIVRARDDGSVRLLRNTRLHGRSFVDGFVPRTAVPAASDAAPFVATVEIARLPARQRFSPDTMLFTDFTRGTLHRMGGFFRAPPPFEELFGVVAPMQVLDGAGAARRLAIADLDLDGDADFVLGNGESGGAPPAGQNRMVAGLARRDEFDIVPLGCTGGDDVRGVGIGDVNRDGIPEIAYVSEDNNRVALAFRIDCIGEFVLSTPELGIPAGPNAVAIADLDGDLFGDVVVAARANDTGDAMGDLLGWYRFDPTSGGGFEPLRRIGRVDAARELTVVDLDRDGWLDLVTSAGSSPGNPALGEVLLFRNLGSGTPGVGGDPDALFDAPQVLLGGYAGAGVAAFSDIDHDGDLDLFVPSEADASMPPERSQCGVSFSEQTAPLQFDAAQCLDRGVLEGRYSRVALADLDGDGVDDVGATSFPDGRLGLFAGHRPFQFLLRLREEPSQRLIGDGTESCPWKLELDHLGHPADGPMGIASLRVDVGDFSTPAMVGALVLRRDDGDGVPEPDDDAELARDATAEINELNSGMRWDLQVPSDSPDAVALPGSADHWLCVLGPPRIGNTRLRSGGIQLQARLADLEGGVPVEGLQRNSVAPGFDLAARRVFSDGLEE